MLKELIKYPVKLVKFKLSAIQLILIAIKLLRKIAYKLLEFWNQNFYTQKVNAILNVKRMNTLIN